LFESINGILFPGGDVDFGDNAFCQNANFLLNKAIEANKKGDVFPIWGTCLGFELLHYLTADFTMDVLINVTGETNATRTLNI